MSRRSWVQSLVWSLFCILTEIEEVVLRIQGVVCNRELPPIQRPFKVYVVHYPNSPNAAHILDRQPNRRLYMRQSVTLTGLSSPKFNDAIVSVHAIKDMFRQQVVDGIMEAWVPSNFQGHTSIDIGNQYFTPRQYALQERQVSFSTVVDPDNILSQAMGDNFIHTEDNEVEYYEAQKDAGGTK